MADSKITALTALTAADPANDMLPIVDVSDNLITATGTTKRISINNILACSPSATLASATITGDLTVDTNVLKVDSANNRVGILTASPRSGFALDVLGSAALGDSTTSGASRLTLDGSGTVGNVPMMRLRSAGVQKAFFGLSGGFIGDTSTDAIIATDAAGAAIRFYTSDNGIEVARFNSTGNLAFANTKGIDFSATAGTGTSELLNDYEEGTFTATLVGLTTSPTVPVTTTGRYTKIGREVKISLFFNNVSTVGASGNIRVTGLPFTSANDSVGSWGSFATHQAATFTGYAVSELGPNTTIVEFPWYQSAGISGYSTHNAGTGRYIGATLIYNV